MAVESSSVAPSEEFVESSQTAPPVGAMTNAEDRHPLQDSWSLWYLTADKTKDRFILENAVQSRDDNVLVD